MAKVFVFFLITSLFFFRVEAANLHAIVVCDSSDDSLKKAAFSDYRKIYNKLHFLADTAELKLHLTSCLDKEATPKHLLEIIKNLKVDSDDVIFFYFAGHGFRDKNKKDSFPHLLFEETETACDFISLTQDLVDKGPRLLISLSDCCNNYIPESFLPEIVRNHSYWLDSFQKKRIQTLLVDSEGIFIGTASEPGENAYSWDWGSAFTIAFLETLDEEIAENEHPDWEGVIHRIYHHFHRAEQLQQQPYCLFLNQRPSNKVNLKDLKL